LDNLVPKDSQVQSVDDMWYHMRILPYRTTDNVIDGVVMTFADITMAKQLEESLNQQSQLQAARDCAENIIAAIREPLVVLNDKLRIVSASRAFYRTFRTTPAEIEGQFLYEINQGQWDIPDLRRLLEDVLSKNTQFEDFQVEHDFPALGHKALLLNARPIASEEDRGSLILLAIEETGKFAGKNESV
jgi:two-component system, chemotaxis family, CheB/CheR fusion protein